jgi:membrane peptidoglycan carboxypeptidase
MKRFFIVISISIIVFAIINISLVYFTSYTIDLPEPNLPQSNRIANKDGTITQLDNFQNSPYVELDDVSEYLKNAIVSIEDHRFYHHSGVDYYRIIRVTASNILSGNLVQAGASTITQQFSRNAYPFLSQEKVLSRKITEAATALQVERNYSKDQILELYLNLVHVGHGLYGVESASNYFFGKSSSEVTLGEAATIAGLLKGPGYFSPYVSIEKSKEQRDIVLYRMAELGYISEELAAMEAALPLLTIRDDSNINDLKGAWNYPVKYKWILYQ